MPLPTQIPKEDYDRFLAPIRAHMENGIPLTEVALNSQDQKRLNAVIRTFRTYQSNPFTKPREWMTNRERPYISPQFMPIALQLFEYLRINYSESSFQNDLDVCKWAARRAIKVGAEQGDMTAMLKGVAELRKSNGDFKQNEENDIAKNTASLPWFLVRTPKAISEDAVEYTDTALIAEMQRLGAAIDPHFLTITEKTAALSTVPTVPGGSATPVPTSSAGDPPPITVKTGLFTPVPSGSPAGVSYLTDDIYDEYE